MCKNAERYRSEEDERRHRRVDRILAMSSRSARRGGVSVSDSVADRAHRGRVVVEHEGFSPAARSSTRCLPASFAAQLCEQNVMYSKMSSFLPRRSAKYVKHEQNRTRPRVRKSRRRGEQTSRRGPRTPTSARRTCRPTDHVSHGRVARIKRRSFSVFTHFYSALAYILSQNLFFRTSCLSNTVVHPPFVRSSSKNFHGAFCEPKEQTTSPNNDAVL